MAVFVKSDQTGHRDRCQLHSEEEHQEVAHTDHEVHAQQRGEGQQIEFSPFMGGVLAPQPFVRLQEDDKRADSQHAFDDALHRFVLVHTAEQLPRVRCRNDIDEDLYRQEDAGQRVEISAEPLRSEQVEQEKQRDRDDERQFGSHEVEYFAVIHSRISSLAVR